jgi:tetratricopeptide (TPR) repeat protein
MRPSSQVLADASQQLRAGQLSAAEEALRALVTAEPGNADAWCFLGIALGRQEKFDEAVHSFQEARRLRTDFADAHANLGITLVKQRRFDAAVPHLRDALALKPDHLFALNSLGNALAEQGRLEEAIATLRHAIHLRPDFAEAYINLGILLKEQGQYDESAECYRQALSLRPTAVEALLNLGICLREQGRLSEAVVCYQQALACQPSRAEAHANLAAALVEQGDVEQALFHYQEVLRLRPDCPQAYYGLGELVVQGRHHFTDAERQHMHALVSREDLPLRDRISLHFTLAALSDREEAYAEAITHYRAGNELRQRFFERRGQAYDAERHELQIDELIATFTPAYFQEVRRFGVESELPVFIVGMPRSGTSLVEQILASHPQVFGAGELLDISHIAEALPNGAIDGGASATRVARVTPECAQRLANKYLERLTKLGASASRVIDKFPENYLHLGVIFTLFPSARAIHCRRNALDVCWSCHTQNFVGLAFTASLEDLGHYYRQYTKLMAHWRTAAPRQMFEMEYEELVREPEELSRKLVAFCGLEWDERCLSFHTKRRVVRTASKLQVRQPVYTRAVGRWRHYEAYLGPLIEALRG